MYKMTLNQKLGSTIAVLWIGLILIGVAGVLQCRASLMKDRREKLIAEVQTGMSIVQHFYTLSQQKTISEADAKKRALEAIPNHACHGRACLNLAGTWEIRICKPRSKILSETFAMQCAICACNSLEDTSARSMKLAVFRKNLSMHSPKPRGCVID